VNIEISESIAKYIVNNYKIRELDYGPVEDPEIQMFLMELRDFYKIKRSFDRKSVAKINAKTLHTTPIS